MLTVLKAIFYLGPLIFGFGFLAPLICQILQQSNFDGVFGLTSLHIGLLIGGGLGLIAQLRGRWV